MSTSLKISKRIFSAGSALQAIALLGAGVVASTVFVAPVAAQDYTNVNATGRVLGTDGNPVANATVTMTSGAQGFSRTVVTDKSGAYRISQIPAGSYSFNVTAEGFDTYSEDNVEISTAQTGNQFTLQAIGLSTEIVVTAGRIQVADFDRTTTGSVINVTELATRVPVARNLNAIVQLAPGTTEGDAAFGDLPAISGASVSENAFYLNGLNITDFRKGLGAVTVPFEFYDTIEVKTGGYQAEFGRSTGGVVNAITKSGSNDLHAGVVVSYEANKLSSQSPNTIISDNDGDYRERIDANFYVSGPIIKDRLFVYGLYNSRFRKTGDGSNTANRYDIGSTNSPFWGVKVDAIPLDGHRLEFTYFDTSSKGQTDSFDYTPLTNKIGDAQSSEVSLTGGANYVGRYTGQLADWLTISAAYGKNKNRDATLSNRNDYPTIIENRASRLPAGQSSANIGNATNVSEASYDSRKFYRADVDVNVELLGSHHFRAGYDREELKQNSTQSYTGGLVYQYYTAAAGSPYAPAGSDYYTARTRVVGGVFTGLNEAFYLQDNWSLFDNRINLQLGVRNDHFKNKNALGVAFYDAKNQWAPRLGFTGDVFGDRRTKVYGSYGKYFLPLAGNSSFLQTGGILDYTQYFGYNGMNADGTPVAGTPLNFASATACPGSASVSCTVTGDGAPKPAAANVSASLKSQYVDEYIVGLEQRVGSRWKFGINLTYRNLGRSLEDVAIDAAVNAYCTQQAISCSKGTTGRSAFRGFNQYVLVNPGSDVTVQLYTPINGEATPRTVTLSAAALKYPKAKRVYKAATFTFDREYDGKWSLGGSYTYSSSKGNAEGGVLSDIGQDDTGLTQSFDQPGLTDGSYGFLPGHREHSLKAYGSFAVGKWLTLGANASLESPRKFGCIGLHPTDRFAQAYGAASFYCVVDSKGNVVTDPANPNGDPLKLTPRGTVFESDWNKQLDLSLAFKVPVETIDAQLRLDVFNAFNWKSKLDFSEFGTDDDGNPQADFATVRSYQAPRFVRLQLALRF
jgi:hypothetical protein